MSVYLHAKFEFSSIILTSFRLGGGRVILPPPLSPPQKEHLKSPPRLNGLSGKATLGQILLPFKLKVKEINVSFKGILTFGI